LQKVEVLRRFKNARILKFDMGRFSKDVIMQTAYAAADKLSPIFKLKNPAIVVVPERLKGSSYFAAHEHTRNIIYFDIHELRSFDETEILHTIGEEVGHNLHFLVRPDLFPKARPTQEMSLDAIAQGQYATLLRENVLYNNLLEMIGFYCGLRFLEIESGKRNADAYIERCRENLNNWTLDRILPLIEFFGAESEKRLKTEYQQSPEEFIKAAFETDKFHDSNIEKWWRKVIHRIGYYLGCRLYGLPQDQQLQHIETALQANTVLDFCDRTKLQ